MKKAFALFTSVLLASVLCISSAGCNQSKHDSETCAHVPVSYSGSATCRSVGYRTVVCKLCNTVLEQETLPALGHKASEAWETTLSATCASEGHECLYCERCGECIDFRTFSATEHTFRTLADRPPTCTVGGYFMEACNCGKVRHDIFTPDLGGHKDENGDLFCDECGEELYVIPVSLQTEGSASATALPSVFMGKTTGGIVNVTLGENSLVRTVYTQFSRQKDDPPSIAGNTLVDNIPYISESGTSRITSVYRHLATSNPTFGIPEAIDIVIADTNKTALALVHTVYLDENGDFSSFGPQAFLHWGVRKHADDPTPEATALNAPFKTRQDVPFVAFYGQDGSFLSSSAEIERVLTQPVTEFYAVYQDLSL